MRYIYRKKEEGSIKIEIKKKVIIKIVIEKYFLILEICFLKILNKILILVRMVLKK